MRLGNMLHHKMGWALPAGPNHEVVLSSRVRLARNLADRPFPGRAGAEDSAAVLATVADVVRKSKSLGNAAQITLEELAPLDRSFLVERHLISNLLASEPKGRAVIVGDRDILSLMINEEDHLRLQGIDSGLCLKELLGKTGALDSELSESLDIAYHLEWGYLAACPTNLGTGLRASTLVHLPGLTLTGQINRVLDGLSRLGVIARGLYGEGTKVMGDFYQISNATSLGPAEGAIVEDMTNVVGILIQKENEARSELSDGTRKLRLEDLVYRSLGILGNARMVTYEETMQHLSYVRMGLSLGWKLPASLDTVNELIVLAQPAHIQMLAGKELDSMDRDFLRATLLRRKLE
ncbi:MAG: protein arginine kinase [Elusimicrobiota bacterium]